MTHYCDNSYCDAEAAEQVQVSENAARDSRRRFCCACEEVYSIGVQHGPLP